MDDNIDVQGTNIFDIVASPELFPEEVLAAAVDAVKNRIIKEAYEMKQKLEHHLIARMKNDDASVLFYRNASGEDMKATMKNQTPKCSVNNADKVFASAGFDQSEIGDYVFKASWSKAKTARQVGGEKKKIIDEIFKKGEYSLVLSKKK